MTDVEKYIAGYPPITKQKLEQVRAMIRKIVPDGEESISYGIPTVKLNGKYVIYFAGFKNHISIYPVPRQNAEFKKDLEKYKGGTGTMQIPLDKPLPVALINKIIKFRLKANKAATSAKKSKI
jgi:uncharacterized protein YdhG (YjbR/CyaY superfamily)